MTVLIHTIGHSTRPLEEFIAILKAYGITRVIDVRTVPRSLRNPQFNIETLPEDLKKVGIGYLHMPGVGGLRKPLKTSQNTGWRNTAFRGYADYMQTTEFITALNQLIDIASADKVALMCAEVLPWKCHRSLLSDALVVRSVTVEHILSLTKKYPHRITPWAQIEGQKIIYPPADTSTGG
jgi:uncharacterized protein (DUF488 family)